VSGIRRRLYHAVPPRRAEEPGVNPSLTIYVLLCLGNFGAGGETLATIDDVACDISVVLGSTAVAIHQLLRMGRGAIIELDATEEDEVTVLANNMPVAKGKVTVNAGRIAVSISRLLPRPATLR
jgi:flagellar motor switch protein FliN